MTQNKINLSELEVYRDIYELDLSDAEITELKALAVKYKNTPYLTICYKNLKHKSLHLLVGADSSICLDGISKHKLPVVTMGLLAFNFYPSITELEYIQAITNTYNYRYISDKQKNTPFKNIDEFKNYILNTLGSLEHSDSFNLDVNAIKAFYWAANKLQEFKANDFIIPEHIRKDMPTYVKYILKVLEYNNTRYAFFVGKTDGRYWAPSILVSSYRTVVADPQYNYTDANRYFMARRYGVPGHIYFSDENPILPSDGAIVEIYSRGQPFTVIDNASIDTIIRRQSRHITEERRVAEATRVLQSRMKTKITEMEAGTPFTFNDITFERNKIIYEGQELTASRINTKDILNSFAGNYNDDHLNFDRILNTFLQSVVSDVYKSTKCTGKIGTVDFTVECKKSKNGASLYYINGYRINREEIKDILTRALCYTKQEDFNIFLDSVSSCSLKMHKYLASGIDINAYDEILDARLIFKLPLLRKKNINYISLGGREFRVSDTTRLLAVAGSHKYNMSKIISVLLHKDILGVSGAEVKFIIDEGKKTHAEVELKNKKLTESTFNKFNVVTGIFLFQNGLSIPGHLIKGKKREYVIAQNDMKVYENPTGRYICMVDKVSQEHNGTAKLINRIYALANDAMLATEIHTLN